LNSIPLILTHHHLKFLLSKAAAHCDGETTDQYFTTVADIGYNSTMFKRIIQTGVNLTRVGIHTLAETLKPETPPEAPAPKAPPATKPAASSIAALRANLMRQAGLKHNRSRTSSDEPPVIRKSRIPNLTFTAVGSGKTIELAHLFKPAVLFVSNRENIDAPARWNGEIIQRFYPHSAPIFTANIIVLNEFPLPARPLVKLELRKGYQRIAAQYFADPRAAADWVYILPDWQAEVLASFHLPLRQPLLAVILLNQDAHIHKIIQTPDPMPEIENALNEWLSL
jgi:hypothetical protein